MSLKEWKIVISAYLFIILRIVRNIFYLLMHIGTLYFIVFYMDIPIIYKFIAVCAIMYIFLDIYISKIKEVLITDILSMLDDVEKSGDKDSK